MDPIINNTGRAIVAISLLIFCAGMIVWLVLYGVPTNSLHQSALSWAWTAMVAALAGLGLNVTADAIAKLIAKK